MVPRRSRILLAAPLLIALAVPGAAAAKQKSKCDTLPVTPSRATTDPISFQDARTLTVKPAKGQALRSVKVTLKQGAKTFASGTVTGTVKKSAPVKLKFARSLAGGTYKLTVTGTRTGCAKRGTAARSWKFQEVLPVVATRSGAYAEDYGSSMPVVLRSVGGKGLRDVTASLLASNGGVLGQAKRAASITTSTVVQVPLSAPLQPGDYTLRVTGKVAGSSTVLTRRTPVSLKAKAASTLPPTPNDAVADASTPASGLTAQSASIDWSDGAYAGRESAGVVIPGIGYGELVCAPDREWLRLFSGVSGHQIAMMNWIQRTWEGTYAENALREGVLTPTTGTQMNEGLNKFGPTPEKLSSGTFEGIITDRGAFGANGPNVAAPTTLSLAWSWDFTNAGHERCSVSATFISENAASAQTPLARSLNINWEGEANAAGNDGATAIVPGLGRVDATCAPGPDGVRWVTVTGVDAATVTIRQNSDQSVTPINNPGSVAVPLVNNGMLKFAFPNGATMLMTSRFKINDPDPTQNFCHIAAQVVQP